MSLAEKYELLGCIQCGRCSAGCPVSLKSPLNIRRLVREIAFRPDTEFIYKRGELWDCTTCSLCSLRCPRGLKPHEMLIGIRAELIDKGDIPATLGDALDGTFKHGNPYGLARSKRAEWSAGLNIKDFSQGQQAEVLYFVGCAPSYDTRVQEVARALSKVLTHAGVDFGILGNEENCCGSEIRRMGEEGLFDLLKENNTALFHKYGIKQIVTTSPHCYNVLKNEYHDNSFTVSHYTQVIAKLIESGKLRFARETKKVVTYQDPCFLGKQNSIYEEPRFILHSLPGIEFREMGRCRERSLCCEGGGGRMWVEASTATQRLADVRLKEAMALGAEIIATACPFCLLNLEDAVASAGLKEKLQIKDIMELAAEAIEDA